jgi:hypothetical protein
LNIYVEFWFPALDQPQLLIVCELPSVSSLRVHLVKICVRETFNLFCFAIFAVDLRSWLGTVNSRISIIYYLRSFEGLELQNIKLLLFNRLRDLFIERSKESLIYKIEIEASQNTIDVICLQKLTIYTQNTQ